MDGSALTFKFNRGERKVIFGSSNLRVKEIVLYLHISSYGELSKKELQFRFTLGASAEMRLAAKFGVFFPYGVTFGKFHHCSLFGSPTLCYFKAKHTETVNLLRI